MDSIAIVLGVLIGTIWFLTSSYRKAHKPLPVRTVTMKITVTPEMQTAKSYAGEDHGEVFLARKSKAYRRDLRLMGSGTSGITQLYQRCLSSPSVRSALHGMPTPRFRVVKTHTTQGQRLAGSVRPSKSAVPIITIAHGATPMVVLHELAHYAVDGGTMCDDGAAHHGHDAQWRRVYADFIRSTYPGTGATMFCNSLGVAA